MMRGWPEWEKITGDGVGEKGVRIERINQMQTEPYFMATGDVSTESCRQMKDFSV